MPQYPFVKLEAGESEPREGAPMVDLFFPMSDAPKIGAVIDHEGDRWRRCASTVHQHDSWRPYISSRLPRGLNVPGAAIKHTASGKPIIASRQQEREAAAYLGWARE